MYRHHEESIQKLLEYFQGDDQILAIILGGSVAKGCERIDSDIDAIVVVTEARYEQLEIQQRRTEVIFGYCTYDKGYFDIKYCTKEYLTAVLEKGSEPSRNAFLKARCLYSQDPEIEELVQLIPKFSKGLKQDKLLSFYSALTLNSGYFWDVSEGNPYLRTRAAADIVLYGLRLLLEEQEVLFPCHNALYRTVAGLESKPDRILEKADALLERRDTESKQEFVTSILDFLSYTPPESYDEVLNHRKEMIEPLEKAEKIVKAKVNEYSAEQ